MKILVTNDDGIDSEGLHVLAHHMSTFGEVIVVAPDSEYSGAGAALGPIHLTSPEVRRRKIEGLSEVWTVAGPPALCAMFARLGTFGEVDFIVSGINPGANVGRSVYHSGTVGATLTGRNAGIPGLAVSQSVRGLGTEDQSWADAIVGQKWHSAAQVASHVFKAMASDIHLDTPVVNLNVPNLEISEMNGWKFTELGEEPPRGISKIELQRVPTDPDAYTVDMTWADAPLKELPTMSDTGAILHDFISVSYLSRIKAIASPDSSSMPHALNSLFQD